jgi:hypothetical protein
MWYGLIQVADQKYWPLIQSANRAYQESPYDVRFIKLDLKDSDDRFMAHSSLEISEAFRSLPSLVGKVSVSDRLPASSLRLIPLDRL